MTPLDEDLVQRIDDLGTTPWSGTTYRHVTPSRDPLSGAGARIFGGRWNPRDSFNTIYLAEPAAACAGELERLAQSQGLTVADLIAASRTLHTIAVEKLPVLDLREDAARQKVGLDLADIADDDLTACQSVGQAAHFLNFGGILVPSATGIGLVLAAFESRLRPGQLTALTAQPFTQELYTQIASGN